MIAHLVGFKPWPKIPREKGNIITITEKIDGTNACLIVMNGELVGCQSRNRLIAPGDDNMGFAHWAYSNHEEIAKLGDGYHYGEWAGPGIQKNPHMLTEKTFFLFNTFRPQESLPPCVKQVPVLYQGSYSDTTVETAMTNLWVKASAEGYIPEGIIIYHHNTRSYVKRTFANNEGKWAVG